MSILADELNNDPLTRGYSSKTDAEAATDLNTAYRPGPASMADVMAYMLANRTNTNTSSDTGSGANATIFGRLAMAYEAVRGKVLTDLPVDVFGATATVDSVREVGAILDVYAMVTVGIVSGFDMSATEAGNRLTDLVNAGVMKTTDRDAIEALSSTLLTRAQELGLGTVTELEVHNARAE